MRRSLGKSHLERACRACVLLKGGDHMNGRVRRRLALLGPAHRRALGIKVDEGGLLPARGEVARQVDRERRLTGTSLGIQNDDPFHVVSPSTSTVTLIPYSDTHGISVALVGRAG